MLQLGKSNHSLTSEPAVITNKRPEQQAGSIKRMAICGLHSTPRRTWWMSASRLVASWLTFTYNHRALLIRHLSWMWLNSSHNRVSDRKLQNIRSNIAGSGGITIRGRGFPSYKEVNIGFSSYLPLVFVTSFHCAAEINFCRAGPAVLLPSAISLLWRHDNVVVE